jgi:hypothetical protein
MKVRDPICFFIGLVLFLPLLYFLLDCTIFVVTADRTAGAVETVRAENGRCGRRRSRYDCTRYEATIRYHVQSRDHRIQIGAGSMKGHDQPVANAYYAPDDIVPVAYSRRNPQWAYRDEVFDIWRAPIMTFAIQVALFISAFFGRTVDLGLSSRSSSSSGGRTRVRRNKGRRSGRARHARR